MESACQCVCVQKLNSVHETEKNGEMVTQECVSVRVTTMPLNCSN